jgi:hypothetical protein
MRATQLRLRSLPNWRAAENQRRANEDFDRTKPTITTVSRARRTAQWCAADPGSIGDARWVPALRRIAEEALHRVRDTRTLLTPLQAIGGT